MAEPTMATRAVYCGSAAWRRRIVANPQKRNGATARNHRPAHCAGSIPSGMCIASAGVGQRTTAARTTTAKKQSFSIHAVFSSSIAAKALTAAAAAGLPPRDVVFVMQQRPLSHRASFASRAPTSPTGKPTTSAGRGPPPRTISDNLPQRGRGIADGHNRAFQSRPQRLHRRRRPRALLAACAAARTSGRSIAQSTSLRTLVRPAWSIFTSQRTAFPAANAARPRSTASG